MSSQIDYNIADHGSPADVANVVPVQEVIAMRGIFLQLAGACQDSLIMGERALPK